jgi:hypothetical protein
MKPNAVQEPIPNTMQDTYISVVVDGKPFSLNASNPTFAAMKRAIEGEKWERIPKLVSLAEKIASSRNGSVTVKNGNVYYHGRAIDTSLGLRIAQMVKEGKRVGYMLKFMDNLYQNPSQATINELHEFLNINKLPITDDGCFMAYKIVDANYRDCHTHTFDNHVGQVLVMPRKDVDGDRRLECSNGFHFCSLAYLSGFPGSYIMGIKINPKDVVSIPEMMQGKGRTWRYEVMLELADRNALTVAQDAPVYLTSVLPVERDRKKLLVKVLAHPTIIRAIKKRKLKIKNLRKGTLGRLTKLYASLPSLEPPPPSKLDENPIKAARLQAGLTTSEVAEEMDIDAKTVIDAERFSRVGQTKADQFIQAILAIQARKRSAVVATVGTPEAAEQERLADEDIAAGRFGVIPPPVEEEEVEYDDGYGECDEDPDEED